MGLSGYRSGACDCFAYSETWIWMDQGRPNPGSGVLGKASLSVGLFKPGFSDVITGGRVGLTCVFNNLVVIVYSYAYNYVFVGRIILKSI